jgi:hypothetical protein
MLLLIPYSFVLSNSSGMGQVLDLGGELHQLDHLLGLGEIILVEVVRLPVQVMEGGLMVRTLVVLVREDYLQSQAAVVLWTEPVQEQEELETMVG